MIDLLQHHSAQNRVAVIGQRIRILVMLSVTLAL